MHCLLMLHRYGASSNAAEGCLASCSCAGGYFAWQTLTHGASVLECARACFRSLRFHRGVELGIGAHCHQSMASIVDIRLGQANAKRERIRRTPYNNHSYNVKRAKARFEQRDYGAARAPWAMERTKAGQACAYSCSGFRWSCSFIRSSARCPGRMWPCSFIWSCGQFLWWTFSRNRRRQLDDRERRGWHWLEPNTSFLSSTVGRNVRKKSKGVRPQA